MKNPRLKWLLIGITTLVVVMFFTNPDQTSHLRAITEAGNLRYPNANVTGDPQYFSAVEYHNYGLFSTTSYVSYLTFSYGFLGRVQTTNDITYLYTGVLPTR
jgi:hypothetical protein